MDGYPGGIIPSIRRRCFREAEKTERREAREMMNGRFARASLATTQFQRAVACPRFRVLAIFESARIRPCDSFRTNGGSSRR